jgi:chaperonin GroEL
VALVRAGTAVEKLIDALDKNQLPEIVGAKIILEGLRAPIQQIAENAGFDGAVVLDKILAEKADFGFNAATGEYGSLLKAGIIDPTKVVRLGLQNSVSAASMLVITEAVVADIPKKEEKSGGMPGGMGGMGGGMGGDDY